MSAGRHRKRRTRGLVGLLWAFLSLAVAGPAPLPVGVATIDITPDYPIRLSGYGVRTNESEGVEQRLSAQALALGRLGDAGFAVLLTVDNTGVPAWMTEEVHARLARELALPRAQFALCSTHTHTGPMVRGVLENLFSADIPPDQQARIHRYSEELTSNLVAVARRAVQTAVPAELGWGRGRAGFARNRRTQGGPVDHEVPVLAARDPNGQWRAVLVNYACHCTTLGGDFNRHCGDWVGYARAGIERRFPGARALVAIGCGADLNPQPRGGLHLAQQHGEELAGEVGRLLDGALTPVPSLPAGTLRRFPLPFDTLPTRAEWAERSSQPGIIGHHARRNLARLERGETLPDALPYSVQTWRFGDALTMVFLPGEVVVDYALRLKREYDPRRLWVNAYANDVPAYIPSRRIWEEGGYEGGGAMPYYDRPTRLAGDTEDRIFAELRQALPESARIDPRRAESPPPLEPAAALGEFEVQGGLAIDLVAAEPLVSSPVAVDFGADGRLWVVEMYDYPSGLDGQGQAGGRLKYLSDTDGDGRYDRATVWADDLPFPTGVMAWGRGALVCAAPDIVRIEDTDGDGRPDRREVLFTGFATHNFQARVNGLRWGLDGWVYGAAGLFGGTIRHAGSGREYPLSGRDFRLRPADGAFEAVAGLSQQSRVRSEFGDWFGCDNGAWMWHFPYPEEYLARNPALRAGETRVYVPTEPDANVLHPASRTLERFNDPDHANRVTSACGLEVYRDRVLGEAFAGNAFIAEPVHNLVRRFVVSPSGATFTGVRAVGGQRPEFLASRDNWFRPVEVRTGPEGALWVVDLYRFVVEHPRWIPPDRLARLAVRAGADRGRIYRVRPQSLTTPPAAPDFTHLSPLQWVEVLGGANGVRRDLAHRRLVEQRDDAVLPAIRRLARSAELPAVRVQALHVLASRQALDRDGLMAGLGDPDPMVRRAAVQLSEPTADADPALATRLFSLADDPTPAVRFQLAFTLGQLASAGAGKALGRLALRDGGDPRMRTAILSSARSSAAVLLATLMAAPAPSDELVTALVATARQAEDPTVPQAALRAVLPKPGEALRPERIQLLSVLLGQGVQPETGSGPGQAWEAVWTHARALLDDGGTPVSNRVAALSVLGHGPLTQADQARFRQALGDGRTPVVATAAIEGLRASGAPEVADLLLSRWADLSPARRSGVLEILVSREAWTDRLLAALEAGQISPRSVSVALRQRLLRQTDTERARRAQALFAAGMSADRAGLIARYAEALQAPGDADRGLAVFTANCATCHEVRGSGHAVGPDLATYRGKADADWLAAILDPNTVIEPRYTSYEAETRDGRALGGVVQDENATSVTVVGGGGVRATLLRTDLLALRPTGLSLMPEGFETAIEPAAMADLLAYLKLSAPRPFGSARAADIELARGALAGDGALGPAEILRASERLEYPGLLGRVPMYHCRQTDGRGEIVWETEPAAAGGAPDDWVTWTLPVAMGHHGQEAGGFRLYLGDAEALAFDVALGDAAWAGESLPVKALYRVWERNAEDSNGLLTLSVRRDPVPAGERLRWTVRGNAANSLRWFGIYAADPRLPVPRDFALAPGATVADVAAAILDDHQPASRREHWIAQHAVQSPAVLQAMVDGPALTPAEEYRRIPWIWRVAVAAGRRNDDAELARMLDVGLPAEGQRLMDWQAVVIGGGLINGLSETEAAPARRVAAIAHREPGGSRRWENACGAACAMAENEAVPPGTRYDALRMVAMLPWTKAEAILRRALASPNAELRQGAVSGLLDHESPDALAALFAAWETLAPDHQELAIRTLAKPAARTARLRQVETLDGWSRGRLPRTVAALLDAGP